MKKLFSLFAAALVATSLSAETITLTMKNFQSTSLTSRGISVVATDGTQSPAAYNANGEDLRVYAGGTLTVSAAVGNITSISFELSDKGTERLAALTTNAGIVTQTGTTAGGQSTSWDGSAASVVFTVGAQADFGTDGSKKAGQLDFTAITITTDADLPEDPEPETVVLPIIGADIYAEDADFGIIDIYFYTFTQWSEPDEEGYINPIGDGADVYLSLNWADYEDMSYTYTIDDDYIDSEYSAISVINGNDTAIIPLLSAELTMELVSADFENGFVYYNASFKCLGTNGILYTADLKNFVFELYEPENPDTAVEQVEAKLQAAMKRIEGGKLVILRDGVKYNAAGARVE